MTLVRERCVACRRGSPRVTNEETDELRSQVPEWELLKADTVKRLERTFRFRNFSEALDFASQVGEVAEEEGHHPRLVVEWGGVVVQWWTHKIKGLHRNDFVMAAKTDDIYFRTTPTAV